MVSGPDFTRVNVGPVSTVAALAHSEGNEPPDMF